MASRTVFWFRRDLRLEDNPALVAAAGRGPVLGLFVLDPALLDPAGPPRRRYLAGALEALDRELDGRLAVAAGDPAEAVVAVATAVGADEVVATADFGPYGRERDQRVAKVGAAAGIPVRYLDSPYAVAPGTLRTGSGTPFQVFTPFHRAWSAHGWAEPVGVPDVTWLARPAGTISPDQETIAGPADPADRATRATRATRADPAAPGVPTAPGVPAGPEVPGAAGSGGEQAAHERFEAFLAAGVAGYDTDRDRPGEASTSELSAALKYGLLHPRQILARLPAAAGPDAFARQLAWRDFYGDVLFHRPASARAAYQPKLAAMELDTGAEADRRFQAWAEGRTGYPIVDAGMRQLATSGWMHNRVRMIVASFLVKDLHLDWTRGARWFMRHLVDGDLANNSHGWQWVAGTGTDAAPYFRIFNPVSQGQKFDPDGRYVRRWVPEVAHLADRWVHQPWADPHGAPAGYPGPVVDHDRERKEALARYQRLTGR